MLRRSRGALLYLIGHAIDGVERLDAVDSRDSQRLSGEPRSDRVGLYVEARAPWRSVVAACGAVIGLWMSLAAPPVAAPKVLAERAAQTSGSRVALAASAILARYEKAAGGLALRRVRALQFTGKYTAPTAARPSGTIAVSFLAPEYFDQRRVFQTAGGHSHSIRVTLATDKAWVSGGKLVMPGVPDPPMRHAREEFLNLMLGVLPGRLVADGLVVAGDVARDEGTPPLECLSLEVVNLLVRPGFVRAVCFEPRSGLPAEIRFWHRARDVVRFTDYQTVDGVKLPREVRFLYAGHVGRIYQDISYVVNPPLTSAMFGPGGAH